MKKIYSSIQPYLCELESTINQLMDLDNNDLNNISKYFLSNYGKQLRPALVFLTSGICGGITKKTQIGALLISLLHNATLLHDDVIDKSDLRRGNPTVNKIWGNKTSVLFGDFLLSKILGIICDFNCMDLLEVIAKAIKQLVYGELLQSTAYINLHNLQNATTTYFEIIRCKTGSLFEACFTIGTITTESEFLTKEMISIGEDFGIAFQLKDDLLDYGSGNADASKPLCMDFKLMLATMPLINALGNAPEELKTKVVNTFLQKEATMTTNEIVKFVKDYGGIDHTKQLIYDYKNRIVETIKKLPQSQYKHDIMELIDYVM